MTADQRGSINHPWIVKIEKSEVNFDDPSDTEGHHTLDAALCCAIFEVAKGELPGTLTLKSCELRSNGHLLTGRQALFMVYSEFAIDKERSALYDLSDLMLLRFKSDDQAPRFLNLWQHTVQSFSERQPDSNLMTLPKAQLENSPALKLDMAHFNRLPKGDQERTYDYLMTSLKRLVDTAKKKQNREKMLTKLSGGRQRPTVLAVPAEEERDTNVCIAFQNTGSCRFGDTRCRFTHSPNAAPKAKAKPKPKAGPKAEPAAKPKAAPKAGPRTSTTQSSWPPALRPRATHSPTEDAASETRATTLTRRTRRMSRCTSQRSTSPTTLISRSPLRRKKMKKMFMASSTTRASS